VVQHRHSALHLLDAHHHDTADAGQDDLHEHFDHQAGEGCRHGISASQGNRSVATVNCFSRPFRAGKAAVVVKRFASLFEKRAGC